MGQKLSTMIKEFDLSSNNVSEFLNICFVEGKHFEIDGTELYDILNLLTSVANLCEYRKDHKMNLNCLKMIMFFFFNSNLKLGSTLESLLTEAQFSEENEEEIINPRNKTMAKFIFVWLTTQIAKNLNFCANGTLKNYVEWL